MKLTIIKIQETKNFLYKPLRLHAYEIDVTYGFKLEDGCKWNWFGKTSCYKRWWN